MDLAERLKKAEAYIAELEAHIQRQHTCVTCECSLVPIESPPHCHTCIVDPSADATLEWVKAWRDDPVKQLREKVGWPGETL